MINVLQPLTHPSYVKLQVLAECSNFILGEYFFQNSPVQGSLQDLNLQGRLGSILTLRLSSFEILNAFNFTYGAKLVLVHKNYSAKRSKFLMEIEFSIFLSKVSFEPELSCTF